MFDAGLCGAKPELRVVNLGVSQDQEGGALQRVEAWCIATALIDATWIDAVEMQKHPLLKGPAAQLVQAVGSIAANVAEGYSRRSSRERIRFYEYALGSTEEARAWYRVGQRAIGPQVHGSRGKELTSIRRLLLTMIRNERAGGSWNSTKRRGR